MANKAFLFLVMVQLMIGVLVTKLPQKLVTADTQLLIEMKAALLPHTVRWLDVTLLLNVKNSLIFFGDFQVLNRPCAQSIRAQTAPVFIAF